MTGEFIPQVLLSASIGLMLSFVAARRAVMALILFAMTAVLGFVVPLFLTGIILTALLLTASLAAILVYVPAWRWSAFALPVCLTAGYWLGARTAPQADPAILALVAMPALLVLPASWLKSRNLDIIIKVAASWLIAIASLSVLVSQIPIAQTSADHME